MSEKTQKELRAMQQLKLGKMDQQLAAAQGRVKQARHF